MKRKVIAGERFESKSRIRRGFKRKRGATGELEGTRPFGCRIEGGGGGGKGGQRYSVVVCRKGMVEGRA